ncbi:alpha/beta hydrolase [Mycobacteroides chelonae]|uniref:Esterase n=1 Tax=Mycobacteroides chelonae TaxID=1774 RepID=A0A1S1MB22_MYCCH|nr:alpha/beta hydrolase [Mycobacteroides chelonae]OHU80552.1 esterase [Mycobacteroides chelonae]QQG86637.1 alpha/beta hydrolase [Mycobacteroides chelonae]QQG91454.1 alpha/beta hydrolase [Mycobacteroides chelonae]
MTIPNRIPHSYPTVDAEMPRRASVRMRIAHRVFHATVRKFFLLAPWIADHRLLTRNQMFAITAIFDPMSAVLRPHRGTRTAPVTFPAFRAEWVWDNTIESPDHVRDAAILYFHGGGFVSCGLNTHRRLVARIARDTGLPVLNVDYRQLPKAHVVDSLSDCLEAYEYLLDNGFPAERIVLAGDSAGGGLTFSVALAARERGLPMPAGIVSIAPWGDFDSTARLAHPNDRTDAALPARAYQLAVKLGIEVDGRLDPAWSPVNHHFAGLPPTLIQVSSTEVLRSDAERLAQRCAEAGVPVTLQIWEKAIHVFQVGADVLPDARDAVNRIALFIGDRLAASANLRTERTSA